MSVNRWPGGAWMGEVRRPQWKGRRTFSLAGEGVSAGFPSPAEEYMERPLDLMEFLVTRPEATYFVRVVGDSMVGAAIHDQDLLVVDRAQEPRPGNVVIALVDGEFTVKRLCRSGTGMVLAPENPDYPVMKLTEETDFQVWGVVRHVIHSL